MYDPTILEEMARRLLKEADSIIIKCALLMALFGGTIGVIATSIAPILNVMAVLGLTFLGGILGAAYGYERSFTLRVQAHTILCQVQIEKNTRHTKG